MSGKVYYKFAAVLLTFYHPMPGATEFSHRAPADRGWVSGNTSGYKVWAITLSTVARLGLPAV